MEHVGNRQHFCEAAPSADRIFAYVANNAALRGLSLEFEYGMIERASSRAVAKFSCQNCATCSHTVVWVTATSQLDGRWLLTHAISTAD